MTQRIDRLPFDPGGAGVPDTVVGPGGQVAHRRSRVPLQSGPARVAEGQSVPAGPVFRVLAAGSPWRIPAP